MSRSIVASLVIALVSTGCIAEAPPAPPPSPGAREAFATVGTVGPLQEVTLSEGAPHLFEVPPGAEGDLVLRAAGVPVRSWTWGDDAAWTYEGDLVRESLVVPVTTRFVALQPLAANAVVGLGFMASMNARLPDSLFEEHLTQGALTPAAEPGRFVRRVRREAYDSEGHTACALINGCTLFRVRYTVTVVDEVYEVAGTVETLVETIPVGHFSLWRFVLVCPGGAPRPTPYVETELQIIVVGGRVVIVPNPFLAEEMARRGWRERPKGGDAQPTPPPAPDGEYWQPPGQLAVPFGAHGFPQRPMTEGTGHLTVENVWRLHAVTVHQCVVYAVYRGVQIIHRLDSTGREVERREEDIRSGDDHLWHYAQWTIPGCPASSAPPPESY